MERCSERKSMAEPNANSIRDLITEGEKERRRTYFYPEIAGRARNFVLTF